MVKAFKASFHRFDQRWRPIPVGERRQRANGNPVETHLMTSPVPFGSRAGDSHGAIRGVARVVVER